LAAKIRNNFETKSFLGKNIKINYLFCQVRIFMYLCTPNKAKANIEYLKGIIR